MARRLIINADGFGFTFGNNRGIFECMGHGLITSVSVNTSFPAVEETFELARRHPKVSIGVHFNLQVGRPVLPPERIPSLVQSSGEFWGPAFARRLLRGKVNYGEMVAELDAQARVLTDRGIRLSHFDGHQNQHLFPPYCFAAMKVARALGIERMRCHRRWIYLKNPAGRAAQLFGYYLRNPKRILTHGSARLVMAYAGLRGIRMADRMISPAYADASRKYFVETWVDIMRQIPEGTNEAYCHPGYPDDDLRRYAKYVEERRQEIEVFCSDALKKAVTDAGIELISFHDI